MWRKFLRFLIAGAALAALLHGAPDFDALISSAKDFAGKSLKTLQKLSTNKDTMREMGFASEQELSSLSLGAPLPISTITARDLAEPPPQDIDTIVHPSSRFLFPVSAKEATRAGILLNRTNDGWRAVSYGMPAMTRAYAQTRQMVAKELNVPIASFFAIEVRSLNAYFVATKAKGPLLAASLFDDPRLGLKAAQVIEMKILAERLRASAQPNAHKPG